MYEKYGLFIGGGWTGATGGASATVTSPVTEAPLGEAPAADPADTEARASGFNAGFFLAPTVLTDVTDDMAVFAGENFGPIAAITRFRGEDEALVRANAGDMGLAADAFTREPGRARRTVAGLKAGMVGINSFAMAAAEAPFGGTGYLGMGREGGAEGISDYLDTKLAQLVF